MSNIVLVCKRYFEHLSRVYEKDKKYEVLIINYDGKLRGTEYYILTDKYNLDADGANGVPYEYRTQGLWFYEESDPTEENIWDYFYTCVELRKSKLEKINESR